MTTNDPYEDAAWCYTGFDCSQCLAYECADPHDANVTAKAARAKGWLVEAVAGDWKVLCPQCRSGIVETYCSCCGRARSVYEKQGHDPECMWREE